MLLRLASLLALLLLPGCATITQGGAQNVTVTTNPPGASCRLERGDTAIGIIAPTPGTLRVDKGRNDLMVICTRDGHDVTTVRHPAEFGGATFGNIIIGGLIGVAVDAASGANFSYYPELVINLQATGGPPVVQPARPIPVHIAPSPDSLAGNPGATGGGIPGFAATPPPPTPPPPSQPLPAPKP